MKRRLAKKIYKYAFLYPPYHKASKYWRKRWSDYLDTTLGIKTKVDVRIIKALTLHE